MDMDKNSVFVVSSVLCNRTLCKHSDITLQRNVGGGQLARMGGGRGWGLAANTGLLREIYMFCVAGEHVMGVSMVIAAWGEGVMCAFVPPPPRRIARRLPKTRVKNWPGLLMFYDDGVRMMGVLVVIAAWREGVNVCLCPPSP